MSKKELTYLIGFHSNGVSELKDWLTFLININFIIQKLNMVIVNWVFLIDYLKARYIIFLTL